MACNILNTVLSYINKLYGGGACKEELVQHILKIFKYIYIRLVLSDKIQSQIKT